MQTFSTIASAFLHALSYISWRDLIEIGALSYAIYRFLQWLNQDVHKELVLYCYAYCGLIFVTHYLKLTILSQTLLLMVPVVVSIFIVLHQHTLQKNFVALHPLKPAVPTTEHWIDELMRASLYAMNRSRHIIWVIERTQSLEAALEAPFVFYADLKKDLLDLLLDTQTNSDTILWVQQTGKLVASNATWKEQDAAAWLSPQAAQLPAWQQQALLVSSKTDAIILHCSSATRLFTMIVQEKSINDLSAHHTSLLLKRLLIHKAPLPEGISYAPQPSSSAPEQHHP